MLHWISSGGFEDIGFIWMEIVKFRDCGDGGGYFGLGRLDVVHDCL